MSTSHCGMWSNTTSEFLIFASVSQTQLVMEQSYGVNQAHVDLRIAMTLDRVISFSISLTPCVDSQRFAITIH